jgi:transposase-like protein
MSNQKRRQWSAERKLQILDEARQTDATICKVCRRHGIGTGQVYKWEKLAREAALNGLRAQKRGRKESIDVARLENELQRLRVVVTKLSAENVELKRGRWP